jgi:transposase InsO family protein
LLERIEGPERPHEIWVADFTYVKVGAVFHYFSTIMDLYTRKIVGYEVSKERNADMVLKSLRKALKRHPGQSPEIFHSDRGVEYANHMVGKQLEQLGIDQSMSGKGNCYDNAHMESFFHTYKSEFVYTESMKDFESFKQKTRSYVRFYNERRLHSSIGFVSPVEYENMERKCVYF